MLDIIPNLRQTVIGSVYHLKWGKSTGTGFLCFAKGSGGECFLTAKHVIDGARVGDTLQVYFKQRWANIPIVDVYHSDMLDISAFTTSVSFKNTDCPDLRKDAPGMMYGQSVRVLGFPHGLNQDDHLLNRSFPIPLVKGGIFSAQFQGGGGDVVVFDALLNPGFSGAPVFIADESHEARLVSMIVSFRPEMFEKTSIYDLSDPQRPRRLAKLASFANSGMAEGVSLKALADASAHLTKFPARPVQ